MVLQINMKIHLREVLQLLIKMMKVLIEMTKSLSKAMGYKDKNGKTD